MKKPITNTTSSQSKLEEAKADSVRTYLKKKTGYGETPSYKDYLNYVKSTGEEPVSQVFYGKLYKVFKGGATPAKPAAAKPVVAAKPASSKIGPGVAQYVAPVPKAADPEDAKSKVNAVRKVIASAGFPTKDEYGNEAVEEQWGTIYIMVPTGERGPRLDMGGGRNGDDWMEDDRVEQLYTAAAKKYGAKAQALEAELTKAGYPAKIRVEYGEKGHITLEGSIQLARKTESLSKIEEEFLFGESSEDKLTEAPKKRPMPDLSAEADEEIADPYDDSEYMDTEDDEEMPEEFLFESKMIFLSNLKDIPPAVGDRCLSIGLHYTKDQALDLIEHKLDSLCPEYPELSIAMKKKIVNFMRKHQNQAKRFSFRSFLHIATIYMSGDPNWEQWALIQMKSLPT